MPVFSFSKREDPALIADQPELARRSRLPLVVFLVTHGLWLATSLAGLILAIGDAHSETGFVVVASRFLEPR
jgi:hypothetical protein